MEKKITLNEIWVLSLDWIIEPGYTMILVVGNLQSFVAVVSLTR